jgi:hypothetical protein
LKIKREARLLAKARVGRTHWGFSAYVANLKTQVLGVFRSQSYSLGLRLGHTRDLHWGDKGGLGVDNEDGDCKLVKLYDGNFCNGKFNFGPVHGLAGLVHLGGDSMYDNLEKEGTSAFKSKFRNLLSFLNMFCKLMGGCIYNMH